MIDWSRRHPGPELMDRDDIPNEDLFQNYRELHFINQRLGGYRITLKGISGLIHDPQKEYSILDVGCGGGNMLIQIGKWGRKKKFRFQLSGLDKSDAAIQYAQKQAPSLEWIREDVFEYLNSGKKFDIITCTLFMHHFSDEKISRLLMLMKSAARAGIVINDLQRHPLAYYNIMWLTKLFSKSYLVKNDAPLSVLRGFKANEWEKIAGNAGIRFTVFNWAWAFRHLIVIRL